MKTLSQPFLDAWNQKQGKQASIQLKYKRRYWNGSAYVYETNWQTYGLRDFELVGEVNWKLDTPLLNVFKTSSVPIRFKNSDYQMLPTNNTSSIFKPDLIATAGYHPFLTKWQINFGYMTSTGAIVYATMFTGVAIDYNFQVEDGYCEVTVSGNDYLLQAADAQMVSIPVGLSLAIPSTASPSTPQDITYTSLVVGAMSAPSVAYTGGGTAGSEVVSVSGGTAIQDITYIAALRAVLTQISVSYSGGGTAGAEVVTVIGNAITVKIQSGTSTATQVLAAINASAAALNLVSASITGTAGHAQTTVGGTAIACANAVAVQIQSGVSTATQVLAAVQASSAASKIVSAAITGTASHAQATVAATYLCDTTTNTGSRQYTTATGSIAQVRNMYDVAAGGIRQTLGIQYTISGADQYGVGAVVDTTYTPGGAIIYDGLAWYTLKTAEQIISLIAAYCSVASGASINPVVWPNAANTGTALVGVFSGSSYSPTWAATLQPNCTLTASGGAITLSIPTSGGGASYMKTSSNGSGAYGTWTIVASWTGSDYTSSSFIYFMDDGSGNGYAISFSPAGGGGPASVGIERMTGYDISDANAVCGGTVTGTGAPIPENVQATWTVTRSTTGQFTLLVNGQFVCTGIDNTYTSGNNYNTLLIEELINGFPQSITLYSITWTGAVTVTMANLSGMTCYDAMQLIANLCGYEFGFDANGNLFFRAKAPATLTPVVAIDQSDGISKLMEFRPGYDAVYNDVQVTYSDQYIQYDSTSLPEAAPTSEQQFLTQILQEDYSTFLLANDNFLALSRAQTLQSGNNKPKRRAKFRSKIIPQLDLSDVVSFSYYNNPRMKDNIFGDPLQQWGPSAFGVPDNVLARNLIGKVIGIALDLNGCTGEYEIQEVVS